MNQLPKIKDLIASLKPQGLPGREELLVKLQEPSQAPKGLPDRSELLRMVINARSQPGQDDSV